MSTEPQRREAGGPTVDWVGLVGRDGKTAAIFPVDPADHRADEAVGISLGEMAATDADRDRLMIAYGDALVTGGRTGCHYKTKAGGGGTLWIEILRFPPAEIAAMTLVTELKQRDRCPLTEQELRVLRLSAADAADAEIAEQLDIAKGTVARHKQNVRSKLGVGHWPAAVAVAVRAGWV
ncbi:MAG: LuxR C-terminal-related transcriptional regulator [Planctomycetota bacterium]